MSLLLDALKRAEQEKHGRPPDPRSSEGGMRESGQPSAAVLELAPVPGSSPPRSDAHAAQIVFDAKAASAAQPASRNRGLWLGIAAAAVVLLLSAGAYVWFAVGALSPRPATVVRSTQPPTPAPAPFNPAAIVPANGSSPAIVSEAPPPSPSEPANAPPPAHPAHAASTATPVEEVLRQRRAAEPERVQLARTKDPATRVPADIQSGYDALVAGDLALARKSYTAALAADSVNVDAQLGLATVDARNGDNAGAARRYQRVLELDSRNPTALAGVAALADLSRPARLEADLRGGIAASPRSAALHAALGDLYAAQGRWVQAQAAYFEAFRLDSGSADLAYNLAVSLDHLAQRRAAASYYRRALDSRRGGEQFDAAAAARRVGELEH